MTKEEFKINRKEALKDAIKKWKQLVKDGDYIAASVAWGNIKTVAEARYESDEEEKYIVQVKTY